MFNIVIPLLRARSRRSCCSLGPSPSPFRTSEDLSSGGSTARSAPPSECSRAARGSSHRCARGRARLDERPRGDRRRPHRRARVLPTPTYSASATPVAARPGASTAPPPGATDLADRSRSTSTGEEHSSSDLRERGALLADLLTEIAESAPGVAVDLYAHSQGGIVTRLALAELESRPGGHEVIESLGLVATMATPPGLRPGHHRGGGVRLTWTSRSCCRPAGRVTGMTLHPRGTNLPDLARRSDLIHELASHPHCPIGPDYSAIGAGATRSSRSAHPSRRSHARSVVPGFGLGAHGDLVDHDGHHPRARAGPRGSPPACRGLVELHGRPRRCRSSPSSDGLLGLESRRCGPVPIDLGIGSALEQLVRW
jgi:hypothetical protein